MAIYALIGKKAKLLEILMNPDNIDKKVYELCEMADISKHTYYRYLKDELFLGALEKARKDLLGQAVIPVINRMIKAAKGKSFNDRKMLFEMAGVYTQKLDVDSTITIKAPEDISKDDMV